ncbi:MAG: glycoside hydrolase family 3 protein, partial [Clostridia bacterium]|nr:glycoside hydrolase family 3 protein [Clostridia bacterium]
MDIKNQTAFIENLINDMSLDDLCGQMINFNVSASMSMEKLEAFVQKVRPGGLFVSDTNKEFVKQITELTNAHTKAPVIIAADVEFGPGRAIVGEHILPEPMAWGACDDAALIEKAGRLTGEICRKNGIHWNFAPVVDINYNKDNPIVNTRAISDKPEQVAKIAAASVTGMQSNGMLLAACKHFPGDGMDDRNQHFCTTINSMSKEEWLKTYGYVYKKMFAAGAASVMVGHIALPAVEDEIDPVLGPKPGTLSRHVITELLRKELGFTGCIVSDAMSMVGACAMCPPDRLAVEFIKAGGDMVLFALERDFDYLKAAVESGEISIERIKESVRYILKMKMQARLFENQEEIVQKIAPSEDIAEVSAEIAEKSIKVVRNTQNLVPLQLKKGAKILIVKMQCHEKDRFPYSFIKELDTVVSELEKRGFKVDTISAIGIDHHELDRIKHNYDCILINCRIT